MAPVEELLVSVPPPVRTPLDAAGLARWRSYGYRALRALSSEDLAESLRDERVALLRAVLCLEGAPEVVAP